MELLTLQSAVIFIILAIGSFIYTAVLIDRGRVHWNGEDGELKGYDVYDSKNEDSLI